MDWEIRKAKICIVESLNGINLPMEVKRLLLVEILEEVSNMADKLAKEQMIQEKEKQEKEQEENENGN